MSKLEHVNESCSKTRKVKPSPRTEAHHGTGHRGRNKVGQLALSCRYCMGIWEWEE